MNGTLWSRIAAVVGSLLAFTAMPAATSATAPVTLERVVFSKAPAAVTLIFTHGDMNTVIASPPVAGQVLIIPFHGVLPRRFRIGRAYRTHVGWVRMYTLKSLQGALHLDVRLTQQLSVEQTTMAGGTIVQVELAPPTAADVVSKALFGTVARPRRPSPPSRPRRRGACLRSCPSRPPTA